MDYFAAFETLELPSDASPKQIRSAYRRLALQWHPDKNPDRRAMAEERFKAIGRAYEILSDPMRGDGAREGREQPYGRTSEQVFRDFFAADDTEDDPSPTDSSTSWEPVLVTPENVFNLPLFELPFIIDLRSRECYRRCHIVTSLSLPCVGASAAPA